MKETEGKTSDVHSGHQRAACVLQCGTRSIPIPTPHQPTPRDYVTTDITLTAVVADLWCSRYFASGAQTKFSVRHGGVYRFGRPGLSSLFRRLIEFLLQCCFTSTETVLLETMSTGRPPRLSHSFWALLIFKFSVVLRPRRPYGLLETGNPGCPPRVWHSSWALPDSSSVQFNVALRPQRPYRLLGTGAQTATSTLTSSWALTRPSRARAAHSLLHPNRSAALIGWNGSFIQVLAPSEESSTRSSSHIFYHT